ncbi:MAG: Trp family transcriptional regulator [Minisyncoccia bacterium]
MPHVSSRKLDKAISKKLWNQFLKTFEDAGKRSATNAIISELLTHTEKIMLAKRLAIILLLERSIPQHVISNKLNVSVSTVTRMSLNVEVGKYSEILKISGKKRILDVLERIILMGMPPRTGRGRWNHWGRFTP